MLFLAEVLGKYIVNLTWHKARSMGAIHENQIHQQWSVSLTHKPLHCSRYDKYGLNLALSHKYRVPHEEIKLTTQ